MTGDRREGFLEEVAFYLRRPCRPLWERDLGECWGRYCRSGNGRAWPCTRLVSVAMSLHGPLSITGGKAVLLLEPP